MAWILGIDEAGYGPNLGPFVMSAAACQLPDDKRDGDLWNLLTTAVRRGSGPRDGRLVIDDSKVVYSGSKGMLGLERAVWAVYPFEAGTLTSLATLLCPHTHAELAAEHWFAGTTALPTGDIAELLDHRKRFGGACEEAGITAWRVHSVVVCPVRFNALIRQHDSKSAVLGDGFIRLLEWARTTLPAEETLAVYIDKQGGRNTYAAQIQQALPGGLVTVTEEKATRSRYRVIGLPRELHLTFQPRMDSEQLCVALASMVSKYLRELCMAEFNRFWQQHVPDLAPTAGYPADAPRFLEAIRAAAATLQISEESIWRELGQGRAGCDRRGLLVIVQ